MGPESQSLSPTLSSLTRNPLIQTIFPLNMALDKVLKPYGRVRLYSSQDQGDLGMYVLPSLPNLLLPARSAQTPYPHLPVHGARCPC